MIKERISYGLGLDIDSENFQASLSSRNAEGEIKELFNRKYSNTLIGFKAILKRLKSLFKESNQELQIAMEVTGVYHEEILQFLHDQGYHVSVLLAKRMKHYFGYLGKRSKTDPIDAKAISQLACREKLAAWKPLNGEILEIRNLFRHRKSLIGVKNGYTNRLHAAERTTAKTNEIERSLKKLIKGVEKEIYLIEQMAINKAKENDSFYEKLKLISSSITGAAIVTVLTIVAETNGFLEFRSIKQLESYAGFDVVENKSGKYEGKTRISKMGNVHLRTAVYMPSLTIIRWNYQPFYNLYERVNLRHGWKIRNKGLVAVQRKLLGMIYTLWKKEEAFDKNYYKRHQKNMPALQPT